MAQPLFDISSDDRRPERSRSVRLVRPATELPAPRRFEVCQLPDEPDPEAEWLLVEQDPPPAIKPADRLAKLVDAYSADPAGQQASFRLSSGSLSAAVDWSDLPATNPDSACVPILDPYELRRRKDEIARRQKAQSATVTRQVETYAGAERGLIAHDIAMPSIAAPRPDDEDASQGSLADMLVDAIAPVPPQLTSVSPEPLISPAQLRHEPRVHEPLIPTPETTASIAERLAPAIRMDEDPDLAQPVNALWPGDERVADRIGPPAVSPVTSEQVAAPDVRPPADRDEPRRHAVTSKWLGVALTILAVPALLLLLLTPVRVGDQPPARQALAQLPASDQVTRLLEVGNRSPAGVDASDVTADQALKRAEAAIFDTGAGPNLNERRFWLGKSISLLLSDPQSRWAVTQLGLLHAQADKQRQLPNYRSAKMLWELASASGDQVAACFVARLYEFGLGVEASKEKARQWQQRAIGRGGCAIKYVRAPRPMAN